jgi:uncharacterized protein YbaP (TraB family)
MAKCDVLKIEIDTNLAVQLSDALFALETLVEHVNALDRLPRQFHRNDWTAKELLASAREWREYCG